MKKADEKQCAESRREYVNDVISNKYCRYQLIVIVRESESQSRPFVSLFGKVLYPYAVEGREGGLGCGEECRHNDTYDDNYGL